MLTIMKQFYISMIVIQNYSLVKLHITYSQILLAQFFSSS